MSVNWEAFVPDLIVGVVTGGVVGLVLLAYERRSGKRRRRDEARAVGLRLVHPLLLALQRPTYTTTYSGVLPLPAKLTRALDLIEASDLDALHDIEPTELTRRIRKFRSCMWDLRADAEDLDQAISRWGRLHARDADEVEYGMAIILGASGSYLSETFPESGVRERLSGAAGRMQDNRVVKKHARKYRKARARVERATEDLLGELVERIKTDGH